jgi:GNAT superfamily N-acetyltransferase
VACGTKRGITLARAVSLIYIDEPFQGKGYGKQFLDWITLQLQKKDFKAIELNAYKENKAGHRFYDREGFVHLGLHFVKRL